MACVLAGYEERQVGQEEQSETGENSHDERQNDRIEADPAVQQFLVDRVGQRLVSIRLREYHVDFLRPC